MAYILTAGLFKSKLPPAATLVLGGVFEGRDACPNCGRPPVLLATLSAGLIPSVTTSVEIPLFFCWTCEGAYEPQRYARREDGSWQILTIASGTVLNDFPFENYPNEFPSTIIPLFGIDQPGVGLLLYGEEDWSLEFCHRVGGEARLLHGGPVPPDGYQFLATISSDPQIGLDYVDNCGVLTHFFAKPDPITIWAFQECD